MSLAKSINYAGLHAVLCYAVYGTHVRSHSPYYRVLCADSNVSKTRGVDWGVVTRGGILMIRTA